MTWKHTPLAGGRIIALFSRRKIFRWPHGRIPEKKQTDFTARPRPHRAAARSSPLPNGKGAGARCRGAVVGRGTPTPSRTFRFCHTRAPGAQNPTTNSGPRRWLKERVRELCPQAVFVRGNNPPRNGGRVSVWEFGLCVWGMGLFAGGRANRVVFSPKLGGRERGGGGETSMACCLPFKSGTIGGAKFGRGCSMGGKIRAGLAAFQAEISWFERKTQPAESGGGPGAAQGSPAWDPETDQFQVPGRVKGRRKWGPSQPRNFAASISKPPTRCKKSGAGCDVTSINARGPASEGGTTRTEKRTPRLGLGGCRAGSPRGKKRSVAKIMRGTGPKQPRTPVPNFDGPEGRNGGDRPQLSGTYAQKARARGRKATLEGEGEVSP